MMSYKKQPEDGRTFRLFNMIVDFNRGSNQTDLKTLLGQLKTWFYDYNSIHLHSVLGYFSPDVFEKNWQLLTSDGA